jgi:hypothetical protein
MNVYFHLILRETKCLFPRLYEGSYEKKKVCLYVSGPTVKGEKNVFYDFLLLCPLSKKHGAGRDQQSKKHCFLPGSKVKTTS